MITQQLPTPGAGKEALNPCETILLDSGELLPPSPPVLPDSTTRDRERPGGSTGDHHQHSSYAYTQKLNFSDCRRFDHQAASASQGAAPPSAPVFINGIHYDVVCVNEDGVIVDPKTTDLTCPSHVVFDTSRHAQLRPGGDGITNEVVFLNEGAETMSPGILDDTATLPVSYVNSVPTSFVSGEADNEAPSSSCGDDGSSFPGFVIDSVYSVKDAMADNDDDCPSSSILAADLLANDNHGNTGEDMDVGGVPQDAYARTDMLTESLQTHALGVEEMSGPTPTACYRSHRAPNTAEWSVLDSDRRLHVSQPDKPEMYSRAEEHTHEEGEGPLGSYMMVGMPPGDQGENLSEQEQEPAAAELAGCSVDYNERAEESERPHSCECGAQELKTCTCQMPQEKPADLQSTSCAKKTADANQDQTHLASSDSKEKLWKWDLIKFQAKGHMCSICGLVLSGNSLRIGSTWQTLMNEHIRLDHQVVQYHCKVCTYVTNSKEEIWSHVKDMHKKNIYSCKLCKRYWDTQIDVELHLHQKHAQVAGGSRKRLFKVQPNTCWGDKIANKCADMVEDVSKDWFRQTLEKQGKVFRCKECGLIAGNMEGCKEVLEKHLVRDHGYSGGYNCQLCHFQTSYKKDIIQHMYELHSEDHYHCRMCSQDGRQEDETFVSIEHLRQHMASKHACGELEEDSFCVVRECTVVGNYTYKSISSELEVLTAAYGLEEQVKVEREKVTAAPEEKPKPAAKPPPPAASKPEKPKYPVKLTATVAKSILESDPTLVMCSKCGLLLNEEEMHKHILKNHYRQHFKCKLCSFKSQKWNKMKGHLALSHPNKEFACVQCKERFQSLARVKTHIRGAHACEPTSALYRVRKRPASHWNIINVHKDLILRPLENCKKTKSVKPPVEGSTEAAGAGSGVTEPPEETATLRKRVRKKKTVEEKTETLSDVAIQPVSLQAKSLEEKPVEEKKRRLNKLGGILKGKKINLIAKKLERNLKLSKLTKRQRLIRSAAEKRAESELAAGTVADVEPVKNPPGKADDNQKIPSIPLTRRQRQCIMSGSAQRKDASPADQPLINAQTPKKLPGTAEHMLREKAEAVSTKNITEGIQVPPVRKRRGRPPSKGKSLLPPSGRSEKPVISSPSVVSGLSLSGALPKPSWEDSTLKNKFPILSSFLGAGIGRGPSLSEITFSAVVTPPTAPSNSASHQLTPPTSDNVHAAAAAGCLAEVSSKRQRVKKDQTLPGEEMVLFKRKVRRRKKIYIGRRRKRPGRKVQVYPSDVVCSTEEVEKIQENEGKDKNQFDPENLETLDVEVKPVKKTRGRKKKSRKMALLSLASQELATTHTSSELVPTTSAQTNTDIMGTEVADKGKYEEIDLKSAGSKPRKVQVLGVRKKRGRKPKKRRKIPKQKQCLAEEQHSLDPQPVAPHDETPMLHLQSEPQSNRDEADTPVGPGVGPDLQSGTQQGEDHLEPEAQSELPEPQIQRRGRGRRKKVIPQPMPEPADLESARALGSHVEDNTKPVEVLRKPKKKRRARKKKGIRTIVKKPSLPIAAGTHGTSETVSQLGGETITSTESAGNNTLYSAETSPRRTDLEDPSGRSDPSGSSITQGTNPEATETNVEQVGTDESDMSDLDPTPLPQLEDDAVPSPVHSPPRKQWFSRTIRKKRLTANELRAFMFEPSDFNTSQDEDQGPPPHGQVDSNAEHPAPEIEELEPLSILSDLEDAHMDLSSQKEHAPPLIADHDVDPNAKPSSAPPGERPLPRPSRPVVGMKPKRKRRKRGKGLKFTVKKVRKPRYFVDSYVLQPDLGESYAEQPLDPDPGNSEPPLEQSQLQVKDPDPGKSEPPLEQSQSQLQVNELPGGGNDEPQGAMPADIQSEPTETNAHSNTPEQVSTELHVEQEKAEVDVPDGSLLQEINERTPPEPAAPLGSQGEAGMKPKRMSKKRFTAAELEFILEDVEPVKKKRRRRRKLQSLIPQSPQTPIHSDTHWSQLNEKTQNDGTAETLNSDTIPVESDLHTHPTVNLPVKKKRRRKKKLVGDPGIPQLLAEDHMSGPTESQQFPEKRLQHKKKRKRRKNNLDTGILNPEAIGLSTMADPNQLTPENSEVSVLQASSMAAIDPTASGPDGLSIESVLREESPSASSVISGTKDNVIDALGASVLQNEAVIPDAECMGKQNLTRLDTKSRNISKKRRRRKNMTFDQYDLGAPELEPITLAIKQSLIQEKHLTELAPKPVRKKKGRKKGAASVEPDLESALPHVDYVQPLDAISSDAKKVKKRRAKKDEIRRDSSNELVDYTDAALAVAKSKLVKKRGRKKKIVKSRSDSGMPELEPVTSIGEPTNYQHDEAPILGTSSSYQHHEAPPMSKTTDYQYAEAPPMGQSTNYPPPAMHQLVDQVERRVEKKKKKRRKKLINLQKNEPSIPALELAPSMLSLEGVGGSDTMPELEAITQTALAKTKDNPWMAQSTSPQFQPKEKKKRRKKNLSELFPEPLNNFTPLTAPAELSTEKKIRKRKRKRDAYVNEKASGDQAPKGLKKRRRKRLPLEARFEDEENMMIKQGEAVSVDDQELKAALRVEVTGVSRACSVCGLTVCGASLDVETILLSHIQYAHKREPEIDFNPPSSTTWWKDAWEKTQLVQCKVCSLIIGNQVDCRLYLDRHLKEDHNCLEIFSCKLCFIEFPNKPQVAQHLKMTHYYERFRCNRCYSRQKRQVTLYDSMELLQSHMAGEHDNLEVTPKSYLRLKGCKIEGNYDHSSLDCYVEVLHEQNVEVVITSPEHHPPVCFCCNKCKKQTSCLKDVVHQCIAGQFYSCSISSDKGLSFTEACVSLRRISPSSGSGGNYSEDEEEESQVVQAESSQAMCERLKSVARPFRSQKSWIDFKTRNASQLDKCGVAEPPGRISCNYIGTTANYSQNNTKGVQSSDFSLSGNSPGSPRTSSVKKYTDPDDDCVSKVESFPASCDASSLPGSYALQHEMATDSIMKVNSDALSKEKSETRDDVIPNVDVLDESSLDSEATIPLTDLEVDKNVSTSDACADDISKVQQITKEPSSTSLTEQDFVDNKNTDLVGVPSAMCSTGQGDMEKVDSDQNLVGNVCADSPVDTRTNQVDEVDNNVQSSILDDLDELAGGATSMSPREEDVVKGISEILEGDPSVVRPILEDISKDSYRDLEGDSTDVHHIQDDSSKNIYSNLERDSSAVHPNLIDSDKDRYRDLEEGSFPVGSSIFDVQDNRKRNVKSSVQVVQPSKVDEKEDFIDRNVESGADVVIPLLGEGDEGSKDSESTVVMSDFAAERNKECELLPLTGDICEGTQAGSVYPPTGGNKSAAERDDPVAVNYMYLESSTKRQGSHSSRQPPPHKQSSMHTQDNYMFSTADNTDGRMSWGISSFDPYQHSDAMSRTSSPPSQGMSSPLGACTSGRMSHGPSTDLYRQLEGRTSSHPSAHMRYVSSPVGGSTSGGMGPKPAFDVQKQLDNKDSNSSRPTHDGYMSSTIEGSTYDPSSLDLQKETFQRVSDMEKRQASQSVYHWGGLEEPSGALDLSLKGRNARDCSPTVTDLPHPMAASSSTASLESGDFQPDLFYDLGE